MSPRITRIRRYPVKGMSGEDLETVELTAGRALPGDRRFGIARGDAGPPGDRPVGWAPKTQFVQLARCARLGEIETAYDAKTGVLTISRGGERLARDRITTPAGRATIDAVLASILADEITATPRLVDAGGTALTDNDDAVISLINLASVRDLGRVLARDVDPRRFRGNLYLDGLPAWAERSWVGGEITLGAVRLRVTEETQRCAATTVNPDTGGRDEQIPKALGRAFGHINMGVYARVLAGGPVTVGDNVAATEDDPT